MGFVSNSSSTSFTAFGVNVTVDALFRSGVFRSAESVQNQLRELARTKKEYLQNGDICNIVCAQFDDYKKKRIFVKMSEFKHDIPVNDWELFIGIEAEYADWDEYGNCVTFENMQKAVHKFNELFPKFKKNNPLFLCATCERWW